jgi:hypothetical protein
VVDCGETKARDRSTRRVAFLKILCRDLSHRRRVDREGIALLKQRPANGEVHEFFEQAYVALSCEPK